MREIPRVMLTAMKSGSGKTTITCGLLAAWKQRQFNILAMKCGPDYIDPMFHRSVLGIDTGNLDSYFTDEGMMKYLLCTQSEGKNLVVLEGAMGYYDGMGGVSTRASAYEISTMTQTPAILVVDAKGASMTVAAMIQGILDFREDHMLTGILLNRVSEGYYPRLKSMLEESCNLPVLGYLPEKREFAISSRHLGLVSPQEVASLQHWQEELAGTIQKTIDLDAILAIANQAQPLETSVSSVALPQFEEGFRIAVARDAAFTFYYRENLELLQSMGAKLEFFSPLEDAGLPDCDALILGGGYPEIFAKQLSENISMRESIKKALKNGLVCLAECGGFLYLGRTLEAEDGEIFDMVGFLESDGYRTKRLQRFGYVQVRDKTHPQYEIRGHEFHYWDSTENGDACVAWKPLQPQQTYSCQVRKNKVFAGFAHLYYPSNPSYIYDILTGKVT